MKRETIDLVRAGESFDGVPIYVPPADALAIQMRSVVELLVTYPRQILNCLALVGLGAASLYLVAVPERKPARRRRR